MHHASVYAASNRDLRERVGLPLIVFISELNPNVEKIRLKFLIRGELLQVECRLEKGKGGLVLYEFLQDAVEGLFCPCSSGCRWGRLPPSYL